MQTTDRLLNGTFFKRVGAYILDILNIIIFKESYIEGEIYADKKIL